MQVLGSDLAEFSQSGNTVCGASLGVLIHMCSCIKVKQTKVISGLAQICQYVCGTCGLCHALPRQIFDLLFIIPVSDVKRFKCEGCKCLADIKCELSPVFTERVGGRIAHSHTCSTLFDTFLHKVHKWELEVTLSDDNKTS